MSFIKVSVATFGFACLMGMTAALDSPCYGYGNIMGSPSKYLEDDLAKVKELKVGQGDVYVANINYLFEGTNHIQLGYKSTTNSEFRDGSWEHGSKDDITQKRYNLRDETSRLLNPGYVARTSTDDSEVGMIGFMFVEHFGDLSEPEPWALAAFSPQNVPYYTYVDSVDKSLKEAETFTWIVENQKNECAMLGDVLNTQLVGFATTIKETSANEIQSMQAIYYSSEQTICSCLDANPTMSRDTVKVEPIPEDESFLDRLSREGKLDTFVNAMITLISLILAVAILVCFLCYFSRAKTPKKQCAFDAYVYVDLQMKTEMRVQNVTEETLKVQKTGQVKPKGGNGMKSIEEEGDQSQLQLQDISNPGSPEPAQKRKSGRSRAPQSDMADQTGNDSTAKLQQR